jgi:general secretion pathway protein K
MPSTWRAEPAPVPVGRPGGRPGFALVAVLWLLLLLTTIAGLLRLDAEGDRDLAATDVAMVQARLIADAGINRALLSLADPRDTLKCRLDGTRQTVDLLDRSVEIAVSSEAAKIDLNLASPALLAALLRSKGGVAPNEADEIAGRITDWRSPLDPGTPDPAADAYRDIGRTYRPPHRPFRSTDELRLVLGMTDELQAALAGDITIFALTPSVDRQVADDDVLTALQEAGDGLAASQLDARRAGQAAGLDRGAAPGEAVTITATYRGVDLVMTRAAIIRLTGDRHVPYRVLAWR